MSNESIHIGDGLELTEIRIWPVRDADVSRVKAMVSLTFNKTLRVNGCRIIEGCKGLFVSYPAEKKVGGDQWVSHAHPVSRAASEAIEKTVIARYELLAMGQGNAERQERESGV